MASSNEKTRPLKIILDSNVFFIPLQFKIDIFEQLRGLLKRNIEFILLTSVKKELETLAGNKSLKIFRQANFALRLAEKCKLVAVEDHGEKTDDIIARTAREWSTPVFTNDIDLKRRLRDISVPVIYLRQKSRLDIDGLIS